MIEHQPKPRCSVCRDVIGVYEPTIAITVDGNSHMSSRAAEPNLTDSADALVHLTCAQPAATPRLI